MSSGLVRDSRCRRSISESNLPTLKQSLDDELPLNAAERRAEAIETLRVRKEAMQEALDKKLTELRAVCLREGELTGVLPTEFPLKANENLPTIRRRVRTEFTFSDRLLMKSKTKEEEKLSKLELDFEIQCKIVKASCKLCNEVNVKKSIRKQRKQMYQQALAKLKDLEKSLQSTKQRIAEMKRADSLRSSQRSIGDNTTSQSSLFDQENRGSTLSLDELQHSSSSSSQPPAAALEPHDRRRAWFKGHLASSTSCASQLPSSISAPSTPVKNRSAKLMLAAAAANAEEASGSGMRPLSPSTSHSRLPASPHLMRPHLLNQRLADPFRRPNSALQNMTSCSRFAAPSRCSESPEYDTISSNASSFGSQPNLKHCSYLNRPNAYHRIMQIEPQSMNEYEQLSEHSPEIEAKKVFGVPTRRSAIALHCSQDDLNLIRNSRADSGDIRSNLDCEADQLIRHNSLENPRRKSYLNATQTCNESGTLSNDIGLPAKASRQTTSINMAQRPLPPPPVEASAFSSSVGHSSSSSSHSIINHHSSTSNHSNSASQLPIVQLGHLSHVTRRKDRPHPPPLNLNAQPDRFSMSSIQAQAVPPQLPPQPSSVQFPHSSGLSTAQPKSSTMCRLHSQQSMQSIASPSPFDEQTINQITDQILMGLNPVRSSVFRTPHPYGSNSSNEAVSSAMTNGHHSPVPNLPPRTPVSLHCTPMFTSSNRPTSSGVLSQNIHSSACSLATQQTGLEKAAPSASLSNGASSTRFASSQSTDLTGSVLSSISSSLNSMHSSCSSHSNLQQSVLNLLTNNSGMLLTHLKQELAEKKQANASTSNMRNKGWTETPIDEQQHSPVIVRNKLPSVSDTIKMHTETIERSASGLSAECETGAVSQSRGNTFAVPATSAPSTAQSTVKASSSLPRTISTSSVSSNQQQKVLQPYWEEVKPYELSDFYKYSQKHRRKPLEAGGARSSNSTIKDSSPPGTIRIGATDHGVLHAPSCPANTMSGGPIDALNGQINAVTLNNPRSPSTQDDSFDSNTDSNFNYTLNEASFMIKTRVAEAFSDEMNAWYEEKYKTATLV